LPLKVMRGYLAGTQDRYGNIVPNLVMLYKWLEKNYFTYPEGTGAMVQLERRLKEIKHEDFNASYRGPKGPNDKTTGQRVCTQTQPDEDAGNKKDESSDSDEETPVQSMNYAPGAPTRDNNRANDKNQTTQQRDKQNPSTQQRDRPNPPKTQETSREPQGRDTRSPVRDTNPPWASNFPGYTDKKIAEADEKAKKLAMEDPCRECRGKRDSLHLLSQCPYFLALTPKEKLQRIDSWGKCRRCWRDGHISSDVICKGRPCRWCGSKGHNTRLHGAWPGDCPINVNSMMYAKAMIEEDLWTACNLGDYDEEPPAFTCALVQSALSEQVDEATMKNVMDRLEEMNRKR